MKGTIVVYILGGACLCVTLEGWEMLESSYFIFISMSTIGVAFKRHKVLEQG